MENPMTIEELIEKIEKKESVSNVDTSEIKDMSNLFSCEKYVKSDIKTFLETFNQPLNDWDVSNVRNMKSIFYNARSFNQPLDDWDVSNVEEMSWMFAGATSFNQPLNNWDVSKVTDMSYMFFNAIKFNQSLNDWNVSNVTNVNYMFSQAINYMGSMKKWNLGDGCRFFNFLNYTFKWFLFNTKEDLPMINGVRLTRLMMGSKKIWKIL